MIAIVKSPNFNKIPASLTCEECLDSLSKITDLANSQHKDKIKSDIYRADDVYEKLKNLYYSKCAYCETFEPEPEIEHYRPKKQVGGFPRNTHEGYYWLCYEWTNLLPACHDCNKTGVKGNFFPIEGVRRYTFETSADGSINLAANKLTSQYLLDEKPLLLNPEMPNFNPNVYFKFDITGLMAERPPITTFEYRQAKETINIVQLNRDKLYLNYRKLKIEELFKEQIKPIFNCLLNNDLTKNGFRNLFLKILLKIKLNASPSKEYSFFWSYLYEYFPDYINHYFKGKERNPLLRIYKEFKDQK